MVDDARTPSASGPDRWLVPMVGVIAVMALALALFGVMLAGTSGSDGDLGGAGGPVKVSLKEFSITPASITVATGERVTLMVSNDGTIPHDLKLEGRTGTKLLDPGERQTIELSPVDTSTQAWCTVPGHKESGMVMSIEVGGSGSAGGTGGQAAGAGIDLTGTPSAGWESRDPALAPVAAGTLHKLTMHATEEVLEIAPGVKQPMWTFGGEVPGRTLHGKVGDTFEVTLVNDGKAGHSIDFHASQTPMDVDMRTIQAGESLVYRFTAKHSGIWMYHCGTAPVLHHIGNGMYGAVVIDPPDLAPVDQEYVFVQSEIYAASGDGVASLDDMLAENWAAVAFNGYANQYVAQPITSAKAGQRVRIWVLDAGPSENTAFHIVGTQWDTVFKEGAYLLRPGNPEQGGSQTLDLQPSQGGFVESAFPADGTYAMVTHKFASASKGALALWKVGDVPTSPMPGSH